jgi:chaperone BCS1
MLSQLIGLLYGALHNQLVSGGLLLMLSGSLIALCRKVPLQLYGWLVRRATIVVDVSSDDPLFAWLSLWLSEQPYSARARALTATSERDEFGRVNTSPQPIGVGVGSVMALPQILLTPAPGNHILWYKRRVIWLSRDRKEGAPGPNSEQFSLFKREVFTLRVLGRSQAAARAILQDARAVALSRRSQKISIYIAAYDCWQSVDERDPRPLSSVFLPAGQSESVLNDLKQFSDSREWYQAKGIPWRRGYLFHGVPGSGKTSFICALAGHFQMNLYILNVASALLSDDGLINLLARVPANSAILLEDIDSVFSQRVKSEDSKNSVTFSGFLNALDGAASKDGAVVFMTTNHIARLDEALIRPGRCDVHVEFRRATADQAARMFLSFFPESERAFEFADGSVGLTMAEIQQHLLVHRGSEEDAVVEMQLKAVA